MEFGVDLSTSDLETVIWASGNALEMPMDIFFAE